MSDLQSITYNKSMKKFHIERRGVHSWLTESEAMSVVGKLQLLMKELREGREQEIEDARKARVLRCEEENKAMISKGQCLALVHSTARDGDYC
jgi:hypothetical protein